MALKKGMKVSTSCRKLLEKENSASKNTFASEEISGKSQDSGEFVNKDVAFSQLNSSLSSLGESPLDKKKALKSKKYNREKIKCSYAQSFFNEEKDEEEDDKEESQHDDTQSEIIKQLKEKCMTATKSEKIQILTVDRCIFETLVKSSEDFVEEFSEHLQVLKKHDFIVKQQSEYFSKKKNSLRTNEAVITGDFSENYFFVLQDEAQSFYWNNSMATVHPFVVYHKEGDVLNHKSFVFISECLKHDTILVHAFQKILLCYLKEELMPNFKKIYYFSDGSAAQYKNRNL